MAEQEIHLLEMEEPPKILHAGDLCPGCAEDRLDYDGLLNLVCPSCGYMQSGCYT